MTLRALIVDDEPIARRRIRRLLRDADVDVVGQCGDGASAVEAVRSIKPDVLFLDVQMPELDGFEVVQALGSESLPAVVFVTAFDQYALRAFDVHALDYLLKPVEADRLLQALDRVRQWRATHRESQDPRLAALLTQLTADRRFLKRVPVRVDDRLVVVDLADVDWISAADNYVTLHVGKRELLMRSTLTGLHRDLDPQQFVRIHRSTIVQLNRIRELIPESHGDYTIVLKDGTTLSLTRGFCVNVEHALGHGR